MTNHRSTGTQAWRKVKTEFRARCQAANARCWVCPQPIGYQAEPMARNSFEADHRLPVATHPHLEHDITNLAPSHLSCNRARRDKAPLPGQWVVADW
jgi:5-methylcytosine-specific restriction endonuclease McrA